MDNSDQISPKFEFENNNKNEEKIPEDYAERAFNNNAMINNLMNEPIE